MYRNFDAKRYWQSKPWCSMCRQRRVRSGTVCHQCLAMMKDKQERQISRTSDLNEQEDIVTTSADTRDESADFDVPGLAEAVEVKFRQWKERLIDLSLRNRLVNFKETRSSTLRIVEPGITSIFDRLVKEEGEYYVYVREEQGFLDPKDTEDATENTAASIAKPRDPNELICEGARQRTARVLYTLRSRAQTELEERGTNVLFIALGFLHWAETPTSSVGLVSPILLIPVQMERQRPRQRYRLTMAPEDIIVNPAVVLLLRNDFGITLPDLPEDAQDLDIGRFLEATRQVVAQMATWQVREDCHIGLFSFLKFMMYKDLEANMATAKRHRIVAALAGFPTLLPDVPLDLVTAEKLDNVTRPERSFQILDADSSQQEAILAALAGVSFVLQGPPGTGKSQTIANIIAECLVAGKRVLFVSEKMAALDVVKRRLDECGLGEFCLELHSHKANKRAVLEQLSMTLHRPRASQTPGDPAFFYQLEERRKQLNSFVRALHSPLGALRLTPFQANGRLARLLNSPDIPAYIPKPLELAQEQFGEIMRLLRQIAANDQIYSEYETHPWKGTLLAACSLQQQTEIQRALDAFLEALNAAIALTSHLTDVFERVVKHLESKLHEKYTPDFIDLELEDLITRFSGQYNGSGRYLRYFSYRMSLRRIRRLCRTAPPTRGESAVADLRLALLVRDGCRCSSERGRNRTMEERLTETMCLDVFDTLVAWIESCLSASHDLAACSSPASLDLSTLEDLREIAQSGSRIVTALRSGFTFLRTLFPLDQIGVSECTPLNEVRSWTQPRHDTLAELRAWLDVECAVRKLRSLGLSEFINESLTRGIRATDLPSAFEKQFYRLWLDEAYGSDPILHSFRSTLHEQAIDEFRRLDERLVQETPRRIISELRSRRPDTGFTSPPTSGLSILQREIQKRRRHMSLRRLLSTVPDLAQTLKPCFLMSPLSVASYLMPGQMKFDILLFDEASQIMPEDAVGSILRSPQVIVVGDTKQLPPTRFFATVEDGDLQDEESAQDEVLDSVMEEALVAFGRREKSLLWHYRSRDESLIAFSNYHFYGNSLITFPAAGTHTNPMGVEFVLVPDGIYDRSRSRTNRREAEHVAKLVYQHYSQCPDRSLGVVAFSLAQADAVDAAVEGLRQVDPGFDAWCNADSHERFFIKNLENVQGDERDVMFFSIGYGPDETGQIRMTFGPLTHEEGRRRLNVAITRAKEHVKLISSFDPSQLDLTRVHTAGVRLLKEYMEVAKHGLDAIPRAITIDEGESGSPFEEEVYQVLREKGLEMQKQIGVSGYRIDLGVLDPTHPGRFLLGIECDGYTYHSFKTARDRDRLRQQVLEGLGWRIHRIWSRDWVENRQVEVDKVLEAVQDAKARFDARDKTVDFVLVESSPTDAKAGQIEGEPGSPDAAEAISDGHPEPDPDNCRPEVLVYERASIAVLHPSYMFELDVKTTADVIQRVVRKEGPIHKVEAAWGRMDLMDTKVR